MNQADISAEIMRQTEARGVGSSICPSEVARALAPDDWRPLMTLVRQAAAALSEAGQVLILRKGKPVPAAEMRGVIRLTTAGKDPA
jgi:hypothetical protein